MTKKSTAAAVAAAAPESVEEDNKPAVVADASSAPTPEGLASAELAAAPQDPAPDPDPPPADDEAAPDVSGRALVDIPEHSLKCGEFGEVPAAAAPGLIDDGRFDPKAVQPKQLD